MRQLMIVEVSQKQAYIFESTKLKENVSRSEEICLVTDPRYFAAVAKRNGLAFDEEKNIVYSGGGHTVLELEDQEIAKKFAYTLSVNVHKEYPELEYFIKTIEYDERKTPSENLFCLSQELEKKKSVRSASFHQGSFGVEEKDSQIRRAKVKVKCEQDKITLPDATEDVPQGFRMPYQLEELGVSRNDSSFIAVVHIDGNGMGNRVAALRKENEGLSWDDYKKLLRRFSEAIDSDFKTAFREMLDEIVVQIPHLTKCGLNLKKGCLPIRKLILAGDDVCFVTEGRIGLEATRIFLEKLSALENEVDHKKYTACGGVAIVHQKYPFYKSYELAEMLCSNAKRFLASFGAEHRENIVEDASAKGCAMDWHIEFGEVIDELSDMRVKYMTADGGTLELRPYLVTAQPELCNQEKIRRYSAFKKLVERLQEKADSYARGKIKELRQILKGGEDATRYYLQSSMIDIFDLDVFEDRDLNERLKYAFSGKGFERRSFVEIDGKKHSLHFDAIEISDTFISLNKEEKA